MDISCYAAIPTTLEKTFCKLIEKCFYSGSNTCVITEAAETVSGYDQILWNYSQKNFIPHATNLDPLPDKQPVYLTNQIENPNQAKILFLIRISPKFLVDLLGKQQLLASIDKLLIITTKEDSFSLAEIASILGKSSYHKCSIKYYTQESLVNWQLTQPKVE